MTVPPGDRYVLLADGRSAHIRPLRDDDADAVQALYRRSSEWSRYLRFFSPVPVETAVRLTRPPADDGSHCMLAAEVDGRLVGLGEYDLADDAGIAEVAFMVEDHEQGHGLGTALLESLVQTAPPHGASGGSAPPTCGRTTGCRTCSPTPVSTCTGTTATPGWAASTSNWCRPNLGRRPTRTATTWPRPVRSLASFRRARSPSSGPAGTSVPSVARSSPTWSRAASRAPSTR